MSCNVSCVKRRVYVPLRCPYTYESGSARVPMSQTRLCVGRHEPGSAESGWARQGLRWGSARYWLVRVWVVPSQAHVSTRPHAQAVWVLSLKEEPCWLSCLKYSWALILEEYREFLVLWQVRSADYSNRAKRDEAWDLLVQFTREKIPGADTPHSSSIITAAATCFDELILDTEMYEQSWESAQARRARLVRVWESWRLSEHRSGDQQPAVRYRNSLKRRTQGNDVRGAPNGPTFKRRRRHKGPRPKRAVMSGEQEDTPRSRQADARTGDP
jgi:hypothetical protein